MAPADSPSPHVLDVPRFERVAVVDADRALHELVGDDAARARGASAAAARELPRGGWDPRADSDPARGGYGLLVLDGLLLRRVAVEGRYGSELLVPGDLLRPWQQDGDEQGVLASEVAWRVIAPSRVAVLDLAWAARMAAFPIVAGELGGRAMVRVRRFARLMAITQHSKLEQRLVLLFWELAQRHGRVRPDGVHIELPLTHEVIASLTCARRPSVTTILSGLAARGGLRRSGRGWLLAPDWPDAGRALR
jgi:hypothetical protein